MPTLSTDKSVRREKIVQQVLNQTGKFTFTEYEGGTYAKLDWWIYQNGDLVGVAEFKGRTTPFTKFPTVFMAERKLIHLMEEHKSKSVIPLMIFGFSDGMIKGIDAREVKPEWTSYVWRTKERASGLVGANDKEPAYEIPIKYLKHFGTVTGELFTEYNNLGYGL